MMPHSTANGKGKNQTAECKEESQKRPDRHNYPQKEIIGEGTQAGERKIRFVRQIHNKTTNPTTPIRENETSDGGVNFAMLRS